MRDIVLFRSAWVNACLLLVAATAVRLSLDPVLGDRAPYLVFTFAVLVAGMRYGSLPGLFTAAVSTIAGLWMFIPPRFSFDSVSTDEWANIVAYVATCSAILLFSNRYRRAREAAVSSLAESRAATSRLQESQQRLAGIVDSAMDAIVTVNAGQHVTLFNPAAERMFGYSASDVCGQSVNRLLPERFRAGRDGHVQRFRQEDMTNRRINFLGPIYGRRSSGEEFPVEASISHVAIEGEQLTTVILRDITERKLNEEAQALLVREVDHRAKNALAVAQALVGITRGETIKEYTEAVTGRVASLARAHSILSQSRWKGAALSDVVQGELGACVAARQFVLCGPAVSLAKTAVQPFSLVLHELTTNAMRHGAASAKTGLVNVSWSVVEDQLELTWMESGGPETTSLKQPGVGLNLLRRTVENQLEGKLNLDWAPQGLRALLTVPSSRYSLGSGFESHS